VTVQAFKVTSASLKVIESDTIQHFYFSLILSILVLRFWPLT